MFATLGVGETLERSRKAAGEDVCFATDEELCNAAVELSLAARSLEAARRHVLAELDARGVCDRNYGFSTGNWIGLRLHEPRSRCRQVVRAATACRTVLPHVDAALSDGTIGADHVRVLVAAAANPRITAHLVDLQEQLIERAGEISFERWSREVAAVVELLDDDGPAPDHPESQSLSVIPLFDGTTQIHCDLTGPDALLVTTALNTEADRLFRRYQSDHDTDSTITIPPRSALLALALVELCRKGLARDVGSSEPPRPEIVVVAHPDDGTLATPDGTPVNPRFLWLLAHDPLLRTLLVADGKPLSLGRSARRASREQRLALAVRDGGCVFPGCNAPPAWCDAHHVQDWEHGGVTDVDNLALLCRHHHMVTHRNGWIMHTTDDHHFTWTTPTGALIDSQRHGERSKRRKIVGMRSASP